MGSGCLNRLMNKYKTLDGVGQDNSAEEVSQKRANRLARATLLHGEQLQSFLSVDKNIVVKSPNLSQEHANSFRSSLYKSSIRRLKQQKVTFIKQSTIASSRLNRSHQSLEEETIRAALKEGKQYKRNILPSLHKLVEEESRRRYSYGNRSNKRSSAGQEHSIQSLGSARGQGASKQTTFEVDGSLLGYKNLKQKYLQLNQLSLNGQRKSQLFEKPQARRHQNQTQRASTLLDDYDRKFKMKKPIELQINLYSQVEMLQAKVNGHKSTIYPAERAHPKQDEETRQRRREFEEGRKQEHVENFIRRKQQFSHRPMILEHPFEYSGEYREAGKERTREDGLDKSREAGKEGRQLRQMAELNPEGEDAVECCPWETEPANFDRF